MSKCAKDALSFFGKCVLTSFVIIDIPTTIALGGCLFLGPAAMPCVYAVVGVMGCTEAILVMTCAAASISEYNKCKEKECKEK